MSIFFSKIKATISSIAEALFGIYSREDGKNTRSLSGQGNTLFSIGNKIVGIIIIMVSLVLIFLPNYDMLEFLNEYMLQYVLLLLISGLAGLIMNDKFILYVSFGSAFMLTLFLRYNSNQDLKLPKPNNQPTIGLVHVNLSSITSVHTLIKLTKEYSYDVISLQEVTPDWEEILLEIFKDSFSHHYMDVRLDFQGKAVFSKYIMEIEPNVTLNNIDALFVKVKKGKEEYNLISVYLTPPLNQKNKIENEKELNALEELVYKMTATSFVFGELNRVYWAKPIIEFRKQTNMMNSRRNVQLSFKTSYSQVFYTGDMECYHFEDVFDDTNVTIGCRGLYQKKKLVTKNRKYRKEATEIETQNLQ
jgi:exonuclease III